MTDLYTVLLGASIAIIGAGFVYILLKRYEYTLVLVAISPFFFQFFFSNQVSYDDLSSKTGMGGTIRAGVLALVGITGLIKYIGYAIHDRGKLNINIVLFFLFIAIAFSSAIYSVDRSNTIMRASFLFTIFAALLGGSVWLDEEENFFTTLELVFKVISGLVFIHLISLAIPSRSIWWQQPRFIGFSNHPQQLGTFFMVAYPILLWRISVSNQKEKIIVFIILGTAVLLHLLTTTRSPMVAAVFGLLVLFLLQRKFLRIIILLVFTIFAFYLMLQLNPEGLKRTESNKMTDLTGREEYWEGGLLMLSQQPFWGYGYSADGKIFDRQRLFYFGEHLGAPTSSQSLHNGYLSTLVGLGIIGLVLWLATLTYPLFRFTSFIDFPTKPYLISIMVMVLVTNFSDQNLTGYATYGDTFFWFAWLLASKISEYAKENSNTDFINTYNMKDI
jgi:O-antigen ligase